MKTITTICLMLALTGFAQAESQNKNLGIKTISKSQQQISLKNDFSPKRESEMSLDIKSKPKESTKDLSSSSTAPTKGSMDLKSLNTQSMQGGQDANGGAGVNEKGRYMTFYSAGLYAEPALEANKVPALEETIDFIQNLSFLTTQTKIQILTALIQSDGRQYNKVTKLDSVTMDRLLAEFQRVTGVQVSDLELFAVTDTNSKKTFLLPAYYKLELQDQMAILFHEAYWLMHPKDSYAKVVAAEMSFQAILDQPDNVARQMDFVSKVGMPADALNFALKHDLATGAITDLITPKTKMISVDKLLGPDFVNCKTGYCLSSSLDHVHRLSKQHPSSLLLKRLNLALSTGKVQAQGSKRESCPNSFYGGSHNLTPEDLCSVDISNVLTGGELNGLFLLVCQPRHPVKGCQYDINLSISF